MKKVVVGMSGGVDSSVAAILLKNQGYEVVGVTMLLNEKTNIVDAKKVCENLKIKHIVLDLRKEFKEIVIDEFIKQYSQGLTPNPCVICNKYFKFGFLYDKLSELDFDYIATGHYAIIRDESLFKGKDSNKDQSYFLAQIPKKKLSKILFPLGNLSKEEVREIARENQLFVFDKKGSTGACFIGEGHFKEFIDNNFKNKKGNIVNIDTNNVVGYHNGLMYHTIGQRKGLNIGGMENRLFVVGKNIEKNIIYVALNDNNSYLYSNSCILSSVNLLEPLKEECTAKFRYRSSLVKVEIKELSNSSLLIEYPDTKSVTPGQLCTLYENEKIIGSGFVKEVRKDNKKLWYLL